MPIYEKPTKTLMLEFIDAELKKGQIFKRADAVRWFAVHYPKIKSTTVRMHVEGMSINSRSRKHHASVKPGSGYDTFFKLGADQFRLWDKETDPAPLYREDELKADDTEQADLNEQHDVEEGAGDREFAYERDLRNYLSRNLSLIEPGLSVYEEEEISGIEFPVGGRFIDILAVDSNKDYVVIELKVSRGYDRTIGQLLRYMGWIELNLAQGKKVRGVIVASNITEDLKLAASRIPDVKMVEYEINFALRPVK